MELRIKELTKIVEASMRLCASVSKGTLFNNSSALVKFSTEEPNQNQGRDFFKIYGQISIPFVQGKSESFSPSRNLRLLVKEGDKKEEPVFELWDSYRLRSVKELKKVHSTIVGNSVFGEMT